MTFGEFLDAELTGLRRYAAVLSGDRQRAHDLLADALLRAHGSWDRIGRMEFPAAYVRRMVTSEFLSERRRWSTRSIRLSRTGDLPDSSLPDPASAVDDRAHLQRLLAGLPPRQRAAVVLRFYLDRDTAEIAAELRITEGAVRTTISRALATLRIAVTDEALGSPAGATAPTAPAAPAAPPAPVGPVPDPPTHGPLARSRIPGSPQAPHPALDQRTEAERA